MFQSLIEGLFISYHQGELAGIPATGKSFQSLIEGLFISYARASSSTRSFSRSSPFQSLIEGLFISYPDVPGALRVLMGFSPSLRDCLFLTNPYHDNRHDRGITCVSVPH